VFGESRLESVRQTFSLFSKLQVETCALTRVDESVRRVVLCVLKLFTDIMLYCTVDSCKLGNHSD
jgi:hypothetical protein